MFGVSKAPGGFENPLEMLYIYREHDDKGLRCVWDV